MKRFYLRGRKLLSMLVSLLRIQKLRFLGINVGSGCVIEGGVIFDKLFPELISIGNEVLIARGVKIFSHDHCKRVDFDMPKSTRVQIGNNAFIAADSIILPGVILGDNIIVGAGSVVTKSFSGNCIIAGNPARVLRSGVVIGELGMIKEKCQK